jgi:hypothetical protein
VGFFAEFSTWLNAILATYIGNTTARVAAALEPAVVAMGNQLRDANRMRCVLVVPGAVNPVQAMTGLQDVLVVEEYGDALGHDASGRKKSPPIPEDGGEQWIESITLRTDPTESAGFRGGINPTNGSLTSRMSAQGTPWHQPSSGAS